MTIPEAAFVHVPELKDRFVQPEDSKLRLTLDDFKKIDATAAADGRPKGWRLSHEEREAKRKACIDNRPDGDLWVFGYGSLMWDPSINIIELRRARLAGWQRRFCLNQPFGRGTAESPGLMMAVDQSGPDFCDGIAMLIPDDRVELETTFLFRREMMTGAYKSELLNMETPQGEIVALVFCANREHERYRNLPEPEIASHIGRAKGPVGTNIDYLEHLVADLEALNIKDETLHRLLKEARDMAGDDRSFPMDI